MPLVWSVALAVLLLGPALGPGYVLTYDMVWVPHLAMRPDFLGLASGLPRAVPSDAVLAALGTVLPGAVLQKLVLLGCLVGGGLGAARWAGDTLTARLAAVSFYQWNPFVTERLLIGHWPVLVGYAVLPWVALAARRWRRGTAFPIGLLVLLPLGSLSASAGLATGVVLVAFVAGRSRARLVAAVLLLVAANAPWVVSGLLHAGSATTDPAGARLFALAAEGRVPAPLVALGLGGIWNAEVVLPSRLGALGVTFLVVVLALAALGARPLLARLGRRDTAGLVACWVVGYALAVLTWAAPGAVAWLAGHVPGGGLIRDGARSLALCAPLLVALVAQGAAEVRRRAAGAPALAAVLAAVFVVLPVTLLPDAALGLAGRLAPVTYPADYAQARRAVAAAGDAGDVLSLPLSSYRQPSWNHDRKVLDPVGRYLGPDYVASDELVVSGTAVAGEDARVRAVAAALGAGDPAERAAGLGVLGVGLVVVDRRTPGTVPEVAGEVLVDGDDLLVLRLADVRPQARPPGWVAAMAAAWGLYAGLALVGGAVLVRRSSRSWRSLLLFRRT